MSNNITISDVAEALGVSKTTVSRAISGKGSTGRGAKKKGNRRLTGHEDKE